MKIYGVTVDLKVNIVSCIELVNCSEFADYVVHSEDTLKWFNIRVEAENPDHALGLAIMYFDKYLIDKVKEKYDQICRNCLKYSKERLE